MRRHSQSRRRASPDAEPFDRFQQWVTREGPRVSTRTAVRYRRYAETFSGQYTPWTATAADLRRWRQEIERQSRTEGRAASASTVNVKMSALRAFFAFLVASGRRKDDPTRDALTLVRVPKRAPRPLDRALVASVFEHLYGLAETPDVLQDRAVLETLYGSGVRREEIAGLVLESLRGRDSLRVVGKGSKERFTLVTDEEYAALRAWLCHRLADARTRQLIDEIGPDAAFDDLRRRFPRTPMFYAANGEPLKTLADPGHAVRAKVQHYFAQVGAPTVTTHQLRHSFATHFLSEGGSLRELQEMLGHEDIRTTAIYVGLEENRFERARRIFPRARLTATRPLAAGVAG
jgi:integrase/recombinase XerC